MQTTPGPEWQPKLKELVDLLLKREEAATTGDPSALRFYDSHIETLLQQLRDGNAPLSLVGELLAGARAERNLREERERKERLKAWRREKDHFDRFEPEQRPGRLTEREEQAVEVAVREAAETGRLHLGAVDRLAAVYTPDVETLSKVFSAQMKVLETLGYLCPMLTLADQEKAPVDLFTSFVPKAPGIDDLADLRAEQIRIVVQSAPNTLSKLGLAFSHEPIERAKISFAEELKRYLKTRIETALGISSSGGKNIQAGTPSVPGLNVRVNSNDSNLQIIYSPAYFVNVQTVFGNTLSTPVDSFLNPGIYIFGARGRQLPTTFESQKYNIPPSTTINLISL